MAEVYANAHIEAARIASLSPDMDAAADKMLAAVKSEAAKHRRTGSYMRGLRIEHLVHRRTGVHDRLIIAEDEDDDVQLIEFGGIVKKTGRIIPGLHIMRRAIDKVHA